MEIEHIGGTSIPDMWNKPVLDIAAGRPADASIQDYIAAFHTSRPTTTEASEGCRAGSTFAEASQGRFTCTWLKRAVPVARLSRLSRLSAYRCRGEDASSPT